jgi:hypothetical protein
MTCFLTDPVQPTVTSFGVAIRTGVYVDAIVGSPSTFLHKKIIISRGKGVMRFEPIDRIKKLMLGIYPFSLLMLTVSFVILMFDTDFRWLVLSVYLFITLVKWLILGRCFGKIKESSFVRFLPLWDLFYALLIPVIFYSSEKKEANRW